MKNRVLLFLSAYALYPPLFRVAEIMARDHQLEGNVIAPHETAIPIVYHPLGRLSHEDFKPASSAINVNFVPGRHGNAVKYGFDKTVLYPLLRQIKPDYIWIHDEFWGCITQQILWYYRFDLSPRIIAYAAHNHSHRPAPLFYKCWPFVSRTRLKQIFLWPRLNGVAACATKSMICARRQGLPARVPTFVNYLPVFGPEEAKKNGLVLPWPRDGAFVAGFVGLLSEQKGWKILLAAIERLPEKFKLVLVGDGNQREEMLTWLKKPALQGRACYVGVLAKSKLLATYRQFDVVVLPSITTPHSVEQFGAVLAEAMGCGVPIIGSDSGSIPEVIGEAGLIVPEGDASSLAQAIFRMATTIGMRQDLVSKGLTQFHNKYSVQAYARSLGEIFGITKGK